MSGRSQWDILGAARQAGLLSEEQAAAAEQQARQAWEPALETLLRAPGLDEDRLAQAAASALGLEFLPSLASVEPPDVFFDRVPPEYARRVGVAGLRLDKGGVDVAAALGPDLAAAAAELSHLFEGEVRLKLAPRREIESLVDAYVRQRRKYLDTAAGEVESLSLGEEEAAVEGVTDFGELMRRTPVVKLVSLLVAQAVRTGSSDIHVQPSGSQVVVRFRTDGLLRDVLELPRSSLDPIISRIKVLGRMDIAERRAAQDGRATFRYAGREIDARMSVAPTNEGERAVLRLLDKEARLLELEDLGLDRATQARFEELIRASHGMILATGPTGSGKNTTLYAALSRINKRDVNIITIEDPVEYKLPGVSQIQVQPKKNVTFASMLRFVVRQDPDVIMVGEIRDAETASSATQAAMTGHLVFSTLHTNDAVGSVARLTDLGVEPFYLASALLGALAQRLVRRVCKQCARETALTPAMAASLGLTAEQAAAGRWVKGEGCEACLGSGYRGRIGIFELMVVDDAIRDLIHRRASMAEIREEATRGGMKLLRQDGVAKAMAGVTTAEEVLQATMRDEL